MRHQFGRGKNAVLLATVLLTIYTCTSRLSAQEQQLDQLNTYVENAMADWHIPGLAMAVIKDGQVIHRRGYGLRDQRATDQVDTKTLFAIASNTKAFTATALGMLVQEGRIAWDDPVLKHLPEFQLYDPVATRKITIRDLLCHRSGLGLWAGDLTWWDSVYDRKEVIRRIRFQEPVKGFRSSYIYCNLMFLVAGEIIPNVTGSSWDAYIHEHFFDPLSMTRSNTSVSVLPRMDNVATPHSLIDGKLIPIDYLNVDNCAPAAAVNSCIDDLIPWLSMHLDKGMYKGRRLINAEIMDELRKPQILIPYSKRQRELNPASHLSAYALGLRVHDYQGRLIVNHTGGLDGMLSYIGFMPEENLGIIILTNSDNHNANGALAYHVFDSLLGIKGPGLSKRYLKAFQENQRKQKKRRQEQRKARVRDTKPTHAKSAYVGSYTDIVYGQAHICEDNGELKLWLSAHPKFQASLSHWHYDTFVATWDHRLWQESLVSFKLDEHGDITQFVTSIRPDWIDTREYVFKKTD
jgi:CubicO group peptidase (beta-lactamase class C family)